MKLPEKGQRDGYPLGRLEKMIPNTDEGGVSPGRRWSVKGVKPGGEEGKVKADDGLLAFVLSIG